MRSIGVRIANSGIVGGSENLSLKYMQQISTSTVHCSLWVHYIGRLQIQFSLTSKAKWWKWEIIYNKLFVQQPNQAMDRFCVWLCARHVVQRIWHFDWTLNNFNFFKNPRENEIFSFKTRTEFRASFSHSPVPIILLEINVYNECWGKKKIKT